MRFVPLLGLAMACTAQSVGEEGNVSKTLYEPDPLAAVCEGRQPTVQGAEVLCDGGFWTYRVEADVWIGRAIANVWQVDALTGGWNEEHELSPGAASPDCSFDEMTRALTPGAQYNLWETNLNTALTCDLVDEDFPGLTFAVRVYDLELNLSDCVIWGADVDLIQDDPSGAGSTGVPGRNPVTDAIEIASCRPL